MLLQFFIKESGEQKNETGVMEKHAYLIIAHTDWSLLKTLVSLLDYELNDIIIGIIVIIIYCQAWTCR